MKPAVAPRVESAPSACNQEALRLVGVAWDAAALLTEVLNDRDFFEESGGGLTLSGGNPPCRPASWPPFYPESVRRE